MFRSPESDHYLQQSDVLLFYSGTSYTRRLFDQKEQGIMWGRGFFLTVTAQHD